MVLADDSVCPKCGQPREEGARFCPTCGQPFDESLTAAPPIVVKGERSPRKLALPALWRPPSIRRLLLILAVAVLAGIAWSQVRGTTAQRTTTAPVANLPPAGSVWFGQSYDPQSFAVTGRTASAPYGSSFAVVARFNKAVTGQVIIAATADGPITLRHPLGVTGTTDLYAMMLATAEVAGGHPAATVRISFLDADGNEIASGTLAVP